MKVKEFFDKVEEIKAKLSAIDMEKRLTFWLSGATEYAEYINSNSPPEMREIQLHYNDTQRVDLYIDWRP